MCGFSDNPTNSDTDKINEVAKKLEENGYQVQTKRLASTLANAERLHAVSESAVDYTSVGAITYDEALEFMPTFLRTDGLAFNIDLAKTDIQQKHAELIFEITKTNPSKTFNFTYTFNNVASSPYFPSATYEKNGFAIGMQPTDLAAGCSSLEDWLNKMRDCWMEIDGLLKDDPGYLGIDSSIAPIGSGNSSFIHFVNRLETTFDHSSTTDFYTKITKYIKAENPKPVGLCGMMLPCTEDVELAAEYDKGKFTIERNIFLSLHSGLGIDTYPIGVDEDPARVVEILKLLQALSNKYQKALSARFVSDGKAAIGSKTDFQNQYLTDCTVRAL